LRHLVADSKWVQTLALAVKTHHTDLARCEKNLPFKNLPLILAEFVIEGDGQVIDGRYFDPVGDRVKDLLICLCNLEQTVPRLAVVRLKNRDRSSGSELAVRLRCERNTDFEPYLLRFAQVDARGRPKPIPLEYRCLIGRGHPDYEGGERVVVDLLSEKVYARLFKDYEGLVAVYQRFLSKA
jgi:hypothetical protein